MKTQAILLAAVALLLGTAAGLINDPSGTADKLNTPETEPDNVLLKSAPNTRKVLPNLVLSPALTQALHNAQNSLVSTIKKEAKLIQRVPEQSELALDDIYIAIDDDISIELSNLKLLSVPSMDIISARPNLEFLNMALDIHFGDLEIGGNYEVVSKKTLAEIPVPNSGEFTLKNSGVKTTGKVGLSLQENFFNTINYDVAYQFNGSYLTVSYLEDNKRIVSALEVQDYQEAKVVAHINRELKIELNHLVKKRLDDILGAVPVDKLIGETGTAESYRKHTRAVRVIANDFVDEVLRAARSYIEDNGLSQISIPNIEASFSKKILFITFYGSFTTHDGYAVNLATLNRKGDISLDYDTNTGNLKVFGSVELSQIYLQYNRYVAKFMDIGPSGSLAAHVGSNSIFLKVELLLTNEPSITLEDVHIEYAKDINVEVTGLGILNWLASKIVTWIVGLVNDKIIGSINDQLHQHISEILPSVDPTKFFG